VASPTILLSAGEASGDLHGAAVARALKARWPTARLFGLGGPRMAAEGVELLAGIEDLAVMGFVEVAGRIPYFMRLMRRVRRELLERETDLVLPIDYPGFNLRLTRKASAAGIPVLYYIAPQVWAWHRSRAKILAAHVSRLAVILPFEEPFFRSFGARAEFVGHPLLDHLREGGPEHDAGRSDPSRIPLVLMPGSRTQEVERHLELFQAAADILSARLPGLQPVVAAAANLPEQLFSSARYPVTQDTPAALGRARAALVKSGTGTLEAALRGVPMVIAYRTHAFSYRIARRLVAVEHIGLVNLVAEKRVFPEFIQDAATPEALANALEPFIHDGVERANALAELARVRERLRRPDGQHGGAANRVAELAAELLADA
jgi:lipid-A-disaccharide synthase